MLFGYEPHTYKELDYWGRIYITQGTIIQCAVMPKSIERMKNILRKMFPVPKGFHRAIERFIISSGEARPPHIPFEIIGRFHDIEGEAPRPDEPTNIPYEIVTILTTKCPA